MSISAAPIADAAVGTIPSRPLHATGLPSRRKSLVKADTVVVPEAR